MHHNPQAYHLITALLNAWEAEGNALGTDAQLLLRQLLQKLPDDLKLEQLKTLLAPVLANTREEQALFYELFDKKLAETTQFFEDIPQPVNSTLEKTPPSVGKALKWVIALLLLVLLTVLGFYLYEKYFKIPPPLPPPIHYEDLFISFEDKIEHQLLFNQYVEKGLSLKSIRQIDTGKINKYVKIRINKDTVFYYETTGRGIDSLCLQFCFKNKQACDTTYYRFIVTDAPRPKDGVITKQDTLAFKPYNHIPDISSLLPTEKIRFGAKYADWNWFKTLALAGIITLIFIFYNWLKRRKQLILKDLKGNTNAPYAWSIQIEGADKVAFNDAFYTASNQLRRRSDSENQRFDARKTVLATIKQGGRINFQYRYQTQGNEYLILIDRQSAANHRAQVFNLLYKAFCDNEVLIERFYYDGDIRLCWNETHKRGILLKDLQHKYPEHRLIVVGSALSLLSPTNGKLAKWATVFDHWRTRALMSTRPPAEWDVRESQLATKFRLLPATLKGLADLVETLEAVEAKDFRLWKNVKDETAEPLRLPETLTPEDLISILKSEYTVYANQKADDRLLQWIAACAVYPTLHWDMTLSISDLGFQISDSRASQNTQAETRNPKSEILTLDNLFHINRLQWFIDGKIPESARKILLNWLAENHPSVLEATRLKLQQILANAQPPKDSIAYEDYRLQMVINDLYLKPDAKKRKALEQELERLLALDAEQDFLVAEYLNRPRTPLDFVVPESLRKYVRIQDDKKLPTTRAWVWQAPLFLLLALGLFLFNPKSKDCSGISAYYKNQQICINNPQDSLTLLEYWLCDNIEMGQDVRLMETYKTLIQTYKDSAATPNGIGKYENSIKGFEQQIDSLQQYFIKNGLPDNATMEEIVLSDAFKLIKNHPLDTASFYKNIPIAYWNAGVKHYNQSFTVPQGTNPKLSGIYRQNQIDSACVFFNRLDRWKWRDSVLTAAEVAFMGKTCFPELVQQQVVEPPKKSLNDSDFEPFQVKKQFGYSNSKTKETLIPPQYQDARIFSEGLAAVKIGNKWGFIDHKNTIVIPLLRKSPVGQYDNVVQNFKGGRAQVHLGKETFFIDKTGKRILENPTTKSAINSNSIPNSPTDTGKKPVINTNPTQNTPTSTSNTQAPIPEPIMVAIEGGTFDMGCDEKRDGDCQDYEKPVHKVTLSNYAIGKYEVTNEEYAAFLNDYGLDYQKDGPDKGQKLIEEDKWGIAFQRKGDIATSYFEAQKGYEKHPVVMVSRYGAVAYCEWLSKKTGKNYRLPTEAEWEYAARGGNKSRSYKYSGSNDLKTVAWYDENAGSKTHPVGKLKDNELGIYDMSGNVWEWCSDWQDESYYTISPPQNPKGPQSGSFRVLRGGSWNYNGLNCRSSDRLRTAPLARNYSFGFRLARD